MNTFDKGEFNCEISPQCVGVDRYNFNIDGIYLSSDREGNTEFNAPRPLDWETFLMVSEEELYAFQFFCGNDWYSHKTDSVISGRDLVFRENMEIAFDDRIISVPELIKSILANQSWKETRYPMTINLTFDRWKLGKYSLYRPLIYYGAFKKAESLECLTISVSSLRLLGDYTGDIFCITDNLEDNSMDKSEFLQKSNVKQIRFNPADNINIMSARFNNRIVSQFYKYQPILYLDLDIIVKNPVQELFLEAMRQTKKDFWVYAETLDPAHDEYWGRSLFVDDNIPQPPYGFNTGIFMYRNSKKHFPHFLKYIT